MDKLKVGIIGTGVVFDLNILGYLNQQDIKITYFIDIVKQNGKPIISGKNAKYVLKFYLAAIRSAELGKKVSVDKIN